MRKNRKSPEKEGVAQPALRLPARKPLLFFVDHIRKVIEYLAYGGNFGDTPAKATLRLYLKLQPGPLILLRR